MCLYISFLNYMQDDKMMPPAEEMMPNMEEVSEETPMVEEGEAEEGM
jgi:hypothetical protein